MAINVTSPSSSSVWHEGSTQTITWTASAFSDPFPHRIHLYKGTSLLGTIATGVNALSYSWTVTNMSSTTYNDEYKIRIRSDADTSDYSGIFQIAEAPIERSAEDQLDIAISLLTSVSQTLAERTMSTSGQLDDIISRQMNFRKPAVDIASISESIVAVMKYLQHYPKDNVWFREDVTPEQVQNLLNQSINTDGALSDHLSKLTDYSKPLSENILVNELINAIMIDLNQSHISRIIIEEGILTDYSTILSQNNLDNSVTLDDKILKVWDADRKLNENVSIQDVCDAIIRQLTHLLDLRVDIDESVSTEVDFTPEEPDIVRTSPVLDDIISRVWDAHRFGTDRVNIADFCYVLIKELDHTPKDIISIRSDNIDARQAYFLADGEATTGVELLDVLIKHLNKVLTETVSVLDSTLVEDFGHPEIPRKEDSVSNTTSVTSKLSKVQTLYRNFIDIIDLQSELVTLVKDTYPRHPWIHINSTLNGAIVLDEEVGNHRYSEEAQDKVMKTSLGGTMRMPWTVGDVVNVSKQNILKTAPTSLYGSITPFKGEIKNLPHWIAAIMVKYEENISDANLKNLVYISLYNKTIATLYPGDCVVIPMNAEGAGTRSNFVKLHAKYSKNHEHANVSLRVLGMKS